MAFYRPHYDAYAHHGKCIILDRHDKEKKRRGYPQLPPLLAALSAGRLPNTKYTRADAQPSTVGILGAGIGGLYTALMLQSLGIPYKIIESRNRTGGRLYTYKFPNSGEYDYFDVGAMRFPLPPDDTTPSVMRRLYHLIHYPPLNPSPNTGLSSKVIPYYYKPKPGSGDYFLFYNRIRSKSSDVKPETFDPQSVNVGDPYALISVNDFMEDATKPFAEKLVEDLKNGTDKNWQEIRANYDQYSTQAYLGIIYRPSDELKKKYPGIQIPDKPLPVNVMNWLETFSGSTSSLSRGFVEHILDSVIFNSYNLLDVEWKCFDGGSQTLSNAVEDYLNQVNPGCIIFDQRVLSISGDPAAGKKAPIQIFAAGTHTATTYEFDTVISTLPLPVLRTLDITPGLLSSLQEMALRQLQYGPAVKIGIRFKSPWWTTGKDKDGNPFNIVGGQSFTDRPIRTVVYPSYGVKTPSNVLIASYCWTNDAERLQALCDAFLRDPSDTVSRKQLALMVLNDLEDVHNLNRGTLASEIVSTDDDSGIYAWNWSHDVHTMGAFAFFGAGQFEDLYDSLNAPSPNGQLHFAGEALSTRHAWVVGALDSAWRAVNEYLILNHPRLLPQFYKTWGVNQEWTKGLTLPGKGPSAQEDLLWEHLAIHRPELFEL